MYAITYMTVFIKKEDMCLCHNITLLKLNSTVADLLSSV